MRELGGMGQLDRGTSGFGDSAMSRSVSLFQYKVLMKIQIQMRLVWRLQRYIDTQVGDFGWGPGFPSDDQEHRCAFHYYGDSREFYKSLFL